MLVQTFKIELKQILGGNHAPFKIFYDKFLERKNKWKERKHLFCEMTNEGSLGVKMRKNKRKTKTSFHTGRFQAQVKNKVN